MTNQGLNGAAAPAEDLRSTIEAAFADDATAELPTTQAEEAATAVEHPESTERARDESGRFIKGGEPMADKPNSEKPVAPPPAAVVGQPVAAAPLASGPPPGWSVAGKVAFDGLPDAVKADIAKREEEISRGFAKLADYKGLDPWVEMARKNGRTLPEVVAAYIEAENQLSENFGDGIRSLCQMYNVDPAQLGRLLTGGKQQDDQAPQSADAFAPVLNRLNSVDQRLQKWERQMEERENAAVQSELQRFAADPAHRYFENVRQTMGQIIAANPEASLNDAYDQACWMNPEIRELLISEKTKADAEESRRKADQARRASGSLPNGSPVPGAISSSGPAPTLRAELERAFEAARI